MKRIHETIEEKPYASKLFTETFGTDWCVLDIETTGLSPKTSKVILVGLAFPEGGSLRTIQIFADSRGEEETLLIQLNELLNRNLTIITYNGASFDLPYLEYRYKANHVKPTWLPAAGLDLYRAVRFHSPLRKFLPNLKQKTVEAYLGLSDERKDEISGAESVTLYEEYETFSNEEDLTRILLHNRDDIVQLSRLLRILDKLDLERIVYFEALSAPCEAGSGERFIVTGVTQRKNALTIEGVRNPEAADYYGFRTGYTFSMRKGKWKLSVPGETIEGCFVVNLSELFDAEEGERERRIPEALLDSPNREGDYLIIATPGNVLYRETNVLIRALLRAIVS